MCLISHFAWSLDFQCKCQIKPVAMRHSAAAEGSMLKWPHLSKPQQKSLIWSFTEFAVKNKGTFFHRCMWTREEVWQWKHDEFTETFSIQTRLRDLSTCRFKFAKNKKRVLQWKSSVLCLQRTHPDTHTSQPPAQHLADNNSVPHLSNTAAGDAHCFAITK